MWGNLLKSADWLTLKGGTIHRILAFVNQSLNIVRLCVWWGWGWGWVWWSWWWWWGRCRHSCRTKCREEEGIGCKRMPLEFANLAQAFIPQAIYLQLMPMVKLNSRFNFFSRWRGLNLGSLQSQILWTNWIWLYSSVGSIHVCSNKMTRKVICIRICTKRKGWHQVFMSMFLQHQYQYASNEIQMWKSRRGKEGPLPNPVERRWYLHYFAFKRGNICITLRWNEVISSSLLHIPFRRGDMTHSQMFQKVEYGWGPIFKVVLECLKRSSEPFLIYIYGIQCDFMPKSCWKHSNFENR